MKKNSRDRDILIHEIQMHYRLHRDAIRSRLMEFHNVPPSEYFYELTYCLLTPQSSAAHAERSVIRLHEAGFRTNSFDPESILGSKENYIRFHKTKAKYLLQMKQQFPDVMEILLKELPAFDSREWLVQHIKGLGYKEATHFLRNIGKNDGLAILDRHILRMLKKLGVVPFLPDSIGKHLYLRIENKFIDFASDIGIVLDELDIVFWSMGTGEIRK